MDALKSLEALMGKDLRAVHPPKKPSATSAADALSLPGVRVLAGSAGGAGTTTAARRLTMRDGGCQMRAVLIWVLPQGHGMRGQRSRTIGQLAAQKFAFQFQFGPDVARIRQR